MTAPAIDLSHARRGALKALREGRVRIRSVAYPNQSARRAAAAAAVVDGHRGVHEVTYMQDGWRCSCPDHPGCAHVLAVKLVTGHAGAVDEP